MPTINVSLQASGPIFNMLVGLSLPRIQAMQAAGLAIPAGVSGRFLLDTGATGTCIDPELIEGLNLPPVGSVNVQTPSTGAGEFHQCQQYDVSCFIPGATEADGFLVPALPILTSHFRSQGIDGLIGRDIINRCTVIYNGSAGLCSLCF